MFDCKGKLLICLLTIYAFWIQWIGTALRGFLAGSSEFQTESRSTAAVSQMMVSDIWSLKGADWKTKRGLNCICSYCLSAGYASLHQQPVWSFAQAALHNIASKPEEWPCMLYFGLHTAGESFTQAWNGQSLPSLLLIANIKCQLVSKT